MWRSRKPVKTGDSRLLIPKVHDCIPILLGSRLLFDQLHQQSVGTFYVSGGWIEGERSFLNEYQRINVKFGPTKATRVLAMMFANYHELLYIRTGHPREEDNQTKSQELAQLLGLNLKMQDGTGQFLTRIIGGPWDDSFIHVAPGEIVQEEYFSN